MVVIEWKYFISLELNELQPELFNDYNCSWHWQIILFFLQKDFALFKKTLVYIFQDGTCSFNKSEVVTNVTGFVSLTKYREDVLKQAVATIGPISAGIDGSHPSFQSYNSGKLILILLKFIFPELQQR